MKHKRRPILVCFIGIDGSGKTTQAKSLAESLKKDDRSVKYVWNQFRPCLLVPFFKTAKLLFFRGKNMYTNYNEFSNTKKGVLHNRLASAIYQYLLLIDYSWQIFPRITVPMMRGKDVICDRYVFDTIADLTVDLNYSQDEMKSAIKKFFHLIPRPNAVFLIDLPEEIAFRRKDDTPSLLHLKERRQIYLMISREYKMNVLDGLEGQTVLQEIIKGKIFNQTGQA